MKKKLQLFFLMLLFNVHQFSSQSNQWKPVPPMNFPIYSLASMGNTLFAGGILGVYKTTDFGQTWSNILTGFDARTLYVNGTELYVGSTSTLGAVYCSTNAGITFTNITPYIYLGYTQAVTSLLVKNGYLYVGTTQGQCVYRCPMTNLSPYSWTTFTTGFPVPAGGALLRDNGTGILSGNFGNGVWSSPTFSPSWTNSSNGIINFQFLRTLTVNGSTLMIGTAGPPQLHRSTDGGANWVPINTPQFSPAMEIWSMITNSNTVYAAGDANGVIYSNDYGISWMEYNNGLKDSTGNWKCPNLRVFALAQMGDTLFAGTNCGIYKSSGCPIAQKMTFYPSTYGCAPATFTLNAQSIGAINWYASPTSTVSIGTGTSFVSPTLTLGITKYYIQNNLCPLRDSIKVSVFQTPTVNISASSSSVCSGSSSTLSASGASTYVWLGGPASSTIVVSPTATTVYTVTGSTQYSCTAVDTIQIDVSFVPVNVVASVASICYGESTTITASGANSYSWNTGPTNPTIVVSPTLNTYYIATGTASNGCTNSDSVLITVVFCTGLDELSSDDGIKIFPNPNSGLINFESENISVDKIQISNILGEIVLEREINGSKLKIEFQEFPPGIYLLKIVGNQLNKTFKIIKE